MANLGLESLQAYDPISKVKNLKLNYQKEVLTRYSNGDKPTPE
jgi:hypothetical protein